VTAVTIRYAHNTVPSPKMGEMYAQHVEPHGRYLVEREPGDTFEKDPRWETGEVTFSNPLHVPFGGGYQEPSNWKHELSRRYDGRTGRSLSRAVARDGHDAIITHGEDGGTSEIVDLSSFHPSPRTAAGKIVPESGAAPEVSVEHHETFSGGATYPHLHTFTATHPDGAQAQLSYMLSKRNSKGVVDRAYIPKDHAHDLGVPLIRAARAMHPGVFVKGMPGLDEDWGQHLPSVTSIHRHLTVKLDPADRDYVHDESVPKAHRAAFLMDKMSGRPSMHWASQRGRAAADKFGDHDFRSPEHTQIAISAAPPSPEHVETDPERISKNGGYAYQAPDWEVPIKEGAPVRASSVRWRTGDSGWTQHRFSGGHPFTAARQREGDTRPHGDDYIMRYRSEDKGERKPRHVIETFHGDDRVGELNWYGTTGVIHHLNVAGEEDQRSSGLGNGQEHQHKGIATAMWNWGQEMTPKPRHSEDRTEQGDAWAKSVGGPRPRMRRQAAAPQRMFAAGVGMGRTAADWFHGSDRDEPFSRFDFSKGSLKHAEEESSGGYAAEGGEPQRWWNSRLGSHFSSEHEVAKEAATTMGGGGNVYHVDLRQKNPKHYESEHDLAAEAVGWARGQGHKINAGYGPVSSGGGWDCEGALKTHPKSQEIADGFRAHLQSQGHDGITYGNEFEGSYRHKCAIAFHPDQAKITETHGGYEPCRYDEPEEHEGALHTAASPSWYHGTVREFEPGDEITAGHPVTHSHAQDRLLGNTGPGRKSVYTHATPDQGIASNYADRAVSAERWRLRGSGKAPGPPRVYQVEFAGGHEPDPDGGPDDHRSQHPLRVVREVSPREHREAAARMIDLYHHTTPEIAAKIHREKRMTSKENTGSIFFTTDPDSEYAAGFGEGSVHVRMPRAHLERLTDQGKAWQDDEFPSGEQHWAIHHSGLRPEHFISQKHEGFLHEAVAGHEEAAAPYVLYHGAHHDDVASIRARGLRPARYPDQPTVTTSRDGAALIAGMRDLTDPRVVEIHVPRDQVERYLGDPEDATEGTVHALRETLPPHFIRQVHTAAGPQRMYAAGIGMGRTAADQVPPEPGATPIPRDHIRLWHYTPGENADSIREHGILRNRAHSDAMNDDPSEPSYGVWASTRKPDDMLHSDSHAAVVEFHAHPDEISGQAESPWQHTTPEARQEWAKGYHHVIMRGDVKPSQIVHVHQGWEHAYHYMKNDDPKSYGWIRDDMKKPGNEHLAPYARALDVLDQPGRHTAAKTWYHGSADKMSPGDEILPGAATGRTHHEHVYLTSYRYWADRYARSRASEAGLPDDGHVYEVEPAGQPEKEQERWSYRVPSARVLREVPHDQRLGSRTAERRPSPHQHGGWLSEREGQEPRCTTCGHRVGDPVTGTPPVETRYLGPRAWVRELPARARARHDAAAAVPPGPYFHGTKDELQVGDEVSADAARARHPEYPAHIQHAWASTKPLVASTHATKHGREYWDTGHVYEVAPLGDDVEHDPISDRSGDVRSRAGFRVVRHVGTPTELWAKPKTAAARPRFYRGGRQVFQPGEMIPPQDSTHVYATSHAANAKMYGPHVYEVEFTGHHEPDPEYLGNEAFRRSEHPLRVVRDATDHATAEVAAKHFGAWSPSQRIFGPTYGLDHRLFDGDKLRPEVRQLILERIDKVLSPLLSGGGTWENSYRGGWGDFTRIYLAGSEASEWTGPDKEGNGDFDTLVGVQFSFARDRNPELADKTDLEIADEINKVLRAQYNESHWHPAFLEGDERWDKEWDLTGFCNTDAWDITDIHPYAAYDITSDSWAVQPPHLPDWDASKFPEGPAILQEARAVGAQIRAILRMPEPYRTQEGVALWNKIHDDRSRAFGPGGHGWDDPGNIVEKWLDGHPHHLLDKLRGLKYATGTADWGDHQDKDRVYLRFGHWPKNERSENMVMGGHEEGVSVYDLDRHGNPEDPDPHFQRGHQHEEGCEPDCDMGEYDHEDFGNDTREEMLGRVNRAERARRSGSEHPADVGHLVKGEMVGLGHDAEPLLNNVRRVGDWIDHRHLLIPGAQKHHLARDPDDEDYKPPPRRPRVGQPPRTAAQGGWPAARSQPLYHGTTAELRPDDHVEPGHPGNWEDDQYDLGFHQQGHVFATHSIHDAWDFAEHARLRNGGEPHVYEVHPAGRMHVDPEVLSYGSPGGQASYRSRSPLRVVRNVDHLVPGEHKQESRERVEGRHRGDMLDMFEGSRHAAAAEDYRYEHLQPDSGRVHWVNAYHPDGHRVGDMTWHAHGDHHVTWISVYDQDDRRRGIATGMWNKAREVDPQVSHNTSKDGQTDAGRDWAQTTSARDKTAAADGPWYHGTDRSYKPGDMAPAGSFGYSYFAGKDPVYAAGYGKHVYEVRPTGNYEPDPDSPAMMHAHRSRESLQIVRRVNRHIAKAEGYVTCGQGHQHWGEHGAAGMLIRHRGDDGRYSYLLQKRSPHVDHGSTWSTPGGALHADETPIEGARREAEEELGSLPDLKHHHTVTDDHGGGWAYHTVVQDSPERFTPAGGGSTDHETAGYGWFTPAEMKHLPLHPGFEKTWATVRHSRTDKTAAISSDGPWLHGTRHEFNPGDMLTPQRNKNKNYGTGKHVYYTKSFPMAAWAADSAKSPEPHAPGRIYEVEPTGSHEDDPALVSETGTNPTMSYRSRHPVRVVREVTEAPGTDKTAGARGDLPDLAYYHVLQGREKSGHHALVGAHDGQVVGHLSWGPGDDRIGSVWVHPEYRRRGVAEALLHRARWVTPGLSHHPDRTSAGDAWAASTGDEVPEHLHDTTSPEAERKGAWTASQFQERLDSGHRTMKRISSKTAALEAADYDGVTGNANHITRTERGTIPTAAVAGMRGRSGERPGEHRNKQGADWDAFKDDIARNGIRNPVFITVDHGEEPVLSEGNHRRDAAVELGLTHVPAEIRYYGHAEHEGAVLDRAGRRMAVASSKPLRMEDGLYYRTHHKDAPFGPEHATTKPIGDAPSPGMEKYWKLKSGYSAFWSPHHLHQYHEEMGWSGGDSDIRDRRVIAFRGTPVGEGSDGEPRVMPHSSEPEESMSWSHFQKRLNATPETGSHWDDHTWGEGPHGQQVDDGYRRIGRREAVITPGSVPERQQAAHDVEDHRSHKQQMLDVARHPDPGTRVWRGELRPEGEHPSEATSAGMHWSVNPDSIITRVSHRGVPGMEGLRPVVWQGIIDHPDEQAIPRSHPMWRGRHESFDHEAEVRFHPGARVRLEGAYVHDPPSGSDPHDPGYHNYLVPFMPERTSPNWKWHPLDHHVTIAHKPGNIGTSDYSDVGIPKEGAGSDYRIEHRSPDKDTGIPHHEMTGGDPEEQLHIYRAVPGDVSDINHGDWVSAHGDWTQERADSEPGWHVLHAQVPARHVFVDRSDRDDDEAGYHGPDLSWGVVGRREAVLHQAAGSGMMVALVPSAEVLDHLQQVMEPLKHETEARDQMHVTVLYLGKEADHTQAELDKLPELIRQFAKTQEPFTASVQGSGTFANSGEHPLIALVDIPGDARHLHRNLCEFLRGHGITFPENHSWISHVTLAYSPHAVRFMPKVERKEWSVSDLWYCRGGIWQRIPLGRTSQPPSIH
jgi:8-oxo-dGTP diphosphatase